MRRLVYSAFVAFLSSAATIVVLARLAPEPRPARDGERAVSARELARHASAADCWLAVSGGVYDVSAYVPLHPAPRRVLTDWCGKEATEAFATKGAGRPHGARARALLARYRLGKLE
ncbi:MAG: cytochrome b5 domain-containing protein [Elusimicrobia bacterium]|nr:cytochrome b5 domain-containing protein [Elusimicrobiota bacterium]